jgi:ribosomal protein S18 acetylase RimI-like enzyme
MIRPTLPTDTDSLLKLSEATKVFRPAEIVALREVLDDYHSSTRQLGHRSVTYDKEGQTAGFAYYAPAAMTDRTWYLYWIVVAKIFHNTGIGSELLRHVEEDVGRHNGRLLFIETSSQEHYHLTRRFYLKHAYERVAVLHGYYADGDDMVIFAKRLQHPKESRA